jgi:hypothetical protein
MKTIIAMLGHLYALKNRWLTEIESAALDLDRPTFSGDATIEIIQARKAVYETVLRDLEGVIKQLRRSQ